MGSRLASGSAARRPSWIAPSTAPTGAWPGRLSRRPLRRSRKSATGGGPFNGIVTPSTATQELICSKNSLRPCLSLSGNPPLVCVAHENRPAPSSRSHLACETGARVPGIGSPFALTARCRNSSHVQRPSSGLTRHSRSTARTSESMPGRREVPQRLRRARKRGRLDVVAGEQMREVLPQQGHGIRPSSGLAYQGSKMAMMAPSRGP